ncbi:hypothetical protein FF38_02320 [Lucilia cuprina]|uniref:Uncharacterized protein n=1 Tax=Lucilia cuprina TaxID=7375 RepID=A0A0L0C409_LUCCU|nr:hypothetical protein FF38_02320 [Lucilia cuprina]
MVFDWQYTVLNFPLNMDSITDIPLNVYGIAQTQESENMSILLMSISNANNAEVKMQEFYIIRLVTEFHSDRNLRCYYSLRFVLKNLGVIKFLLLASGSHYLLGKSSYSLNLLWKIVYATFILQFAQFCVKSVLIMKNIIFYYTELQTPKFHVSFFIRSL